MKEFCLKMGKKLAVILKNFVTPFLGVYLLLPNDHGKGN
jgi:hypothetical protein